jgi:hypothetical protein
MQWSLDQVLLRSDVWTYLTPIKVPLSILEPVFPKAPITWMFVMTWILRTLCQTRTGNKHTKWFLWFNRGCSVDIQRRYNFERFILLKGVNSDITRSYALIFIIRESICAKYEPSFLPVLSSIHNLKENTPRRPFLLNQPVLRTVSSGSGSSTSELVLACSDIGTISIEAEVVAAIGRTPQAHHYNEKATISLLFFVGRFRFEKVFL